MHEPSALPVEEILEDTPSFSREALISYYATYLREIDFFGFWKEISKYLNNKRFDRVYCDSLNSIEVNRICIPEKEPSGVLLADNLGRLLYRGAHLEQTELFVFYILGLVEETDPHIRGPPARDFILEIAAEMAKDEGADKDCIPYEISELESFLEEEDTVNTLELRDRYAAKRVNETLKDSESGILFMGAAHNVREYLKVYKDIRIKTYTSRRIRDLKEFNLQEYM